LPWARVRRRFQRRKGRIGLPCHLPVFLGGGMHLWDGLNYKQLTIDLKSDLFHLF
jgi:hypothetical protein